MVILNIYSESEQMYLVSLARLAELVSECPIPVAQVAELLGVTPTSANQMIHHLEEMGLVTYTPYKGVEFTEEGWQFAVNILRSRRLWEVFLVKYLQYDSDQAETLACQLEHAIPEDTVNRLAEFLGWPKGSPKGKPIPHTNLAGSFSTSSPLNTHPADTHGVVDVILAGETEQEYLGQSGVMAGGEIHILASQHAGPCLIKNEQGATIHLSSEIAAAILINPISSK